jgi:hypothetical protein
MTKSERRPLGRPKVSLMPILPRRAAIVNRFGVRFGYSAAHD